MEIEKIKITKQEHIEAVTQWLKNKGLDLSIVSIDSYGYPIKGWEIDCQPKEDIAPPSAPIVTVEDLGNAIKAGTV